MGWQRSHCYISGGCLLSLSLCRRGFQDLVKVRPSSLFILCGCISSSMASLISQSTYPVLAEKRFVSCSLLIWSWLMLCSTTADLSVCASRTCLLCSLRCLELNHDSSTCLAHNTVTISTQLPHRLVRTKEHTVVPVHTIKACEMWNYSSLIFNLGTTWRRVISFTLQPFHPQKRTLVPSEKEAW